MRNSKKISYNPRFCNGKETGKVIRNPNTDPNQHQQEVKVF